MLAACAQQPQVPNGYQGLNGPRSGEPESTTAPANNQMPKKTLACKVLAAIALERVTGRKPDPARFSELN